LIELWIRGSGVFSIVITAGIVVIVIVTHNLQQARRIADATAFFLSGDLVELAETNVLFNSPSDARTADYLAGRFG
jgi:phosphate transport system ATP-binding protein